MTKMTLRKFLVKKRIDLYEEIEMLNEEIKFSCNDQELNLRKAELNAAQTELNLVKEIIEICENRGKY